MTTHGILRTLSLSEETGWGISLEPAAHLNQRQLEFEQALDPLSSDGEAERVQVSTGMNLKEWIYYTRSSEIFMVRLNDLLSGYPPFPIQIEFFNDPEWQVWGDTLDSLKARGV